MTIRILCIGDLVGKAGRSVLAETLPGLVQEREIDLVVCNGENAAGGSGITPNIVEKLQKYGVDVVTLGDHCYRRDEIYPALGESNRVIRPGNLPSSSPGRGVTVVASKSGQHRIGVLSVMGQLNMGVHGDSPWAWLDRTLSAMDDDVKIRIVDFHAEATSEKIGAGWFLDGRASVVFGTHTHVPTADARVLPEGTGFICDVGMTGPYDSILGRRKDRVLKFMTTAMQQKFEMATEDPRVYGLLAEVDTRTGRAVSVEQIVRTGKAPSSPYDADDRKSYNASHKKK
jgi:2',3'-cyclic-nucleotide 2'-phosphodiesterase